eukprot:2329551-Amphidinium_carterae.1
MEARPTPLPGSFGRHRGPRPFKKQRLTQEPEEVPSPASLSQLFADVYSAFGDTTRRWKLATLNVWCAVLGRDSCIVVLTVDVTHESCAGHLYSRS